MPKTIASGYILLALAVIIGAFGAHALESVISDRYMETYQTGNFYHFIHALAVIVNSHVLSHYGSKRSLLISNLFITGILLFSGSLYLLSLNEYFEAPELTKLGAVTPIGGLMFIGGWLLGAWEVLQLSRREKT
jgi:uncharacterized membrane protein YgdD (TMEM256/DUF423 family)